MLSEYYNKIDTEPQAHAYTLSLRVCARDSTDRERTIDRCKVVPRYATRKGYSSGCGTQQHVPYSVRLKNTPIPTRTLATQYSRHEAYTISTIRSTPLGKVSTNKTRRCKVGTQPVRSTATAH